VPGDGYVEIARTKAFVHRRGLRPIAVAGNYLVTISHTFTALEVIARAKLKVAALVIADSGAGAVPWTRRCPRCSTSSACRL
jgi:dethiobiotin synthetase